jgi:transcriptional regulator with XRE-family HTH domain
VTPRRNPPQPASIPPPPRRDPEAATPARWSRGQRSAANAASYLINLSAPADAQVVLQLPQSADHELIQARARLLDAKTAGTELAEKLTKARLAAGKPAMRKIGKSVGYSVSTVSKVLAGKMPASWKMVRDLAREFDVPDSTLTEQWQPLWIAAESHRQRREHGLDGEFGEAGLPVAPPAGHTCDRCGSWVIDTAKHVAWHMQVEPAAGAEGALESLDEAPGADPWGPVRAELTEVLDPRAEP